MNYGDEVNVLAARVQARMDASTRYALENQRGLSEKQRRRIVELILEVVRRAKGYVIPELVAGIRSFLGV
jgi:hypothetical protein